ncbi:PQQ-binding-like beta-propeller repeat protein [Kitasatospora sp. NPDC057904]|uniref:outer membrane protein assembly factor BamB family protein n=1 Tax=Kitasatospora sp. NPDC057904 TaxID=3346275 RepID=UPI0036DAB6FB
MESPSAGQRSAEQGSWQWDDAGGAGGTPGDVVGGGGEGPRLGRRGLLVGAGVLAGGAALWAFGRSARTAPPTPRPTAAEGPVPAWTYRGAEAMAPERLADRPDRPLFPSRTRLVVLDPASGAPARLIAFDQPRPYPPSGPDSMGSVVFGPDRLFTTFQGRIESRHLTDPGGDWSLPLPEESGRGSVQLAGCDGGTLYGSVLNYGSTTTTSPDTKVFAIRVSDRSVLWSLPFGAGENLLAPVTAAPGLLMCRRRAGERTEVVVRDATDARELWKAPADENLRWYTPGPENIYVPDGTGGVRALAPNGESRWTAGPAAGEQWRALPPVADGTRVYVPRDNGLLTGHDAATGRQVWSYRLPFPLDVRSQPLVAKGVLYVPGPAAGGVWAIDAATGRQLWTFRDGIPGKDVWSLAADDTHLYAGHDDALHALPLGAS